MDQDVAVMHGQGQNPDNVDKAKIMPMYEKAWTDADANGDGGLNEEEWLNYSKKMLELSQLNYGFTVEYDEELYKMGYKALTSWTPHESGVTKAALIPYTKCAYTHRRDSGWGDGTCCWKASKQRDA
mgnify:CR=1 FL=1